MSISSKDSQQKANIHFIWVSDGTILKFSFNLFKEEGALKAGKAKQSGIQR